MSLISRFLIFLSITPLSHHSPLQNSIYGKSSLSIDPPRVISLYSFFAVTKNPYILTIASGSRMASSSIKRTCVKFSSLAFRISNIPLVKPPAPPEFLFSRICIFPLALSFIWEIFVMLLSVLPLSITYISKCLDTSSSSLSKILFLSCFRFFST